MNDEYLIKRLDCYKPALNIFNYYGEQRKNSTKIVDEKWMIIHEELDKIKSRGENCVLIGDMNKLIGNDEWGVCGNNPEITIGGSMLRNLLQTKDYVLVNSLRNRVKGGPFTRCDPANGRLSLLDLVIVSVGLVPYVREMRIDEEKKFTHFSVQKEMEQVDILTVITTL